MHNCESHLPCTYNINNEDISVRTNNVLFLLFTPILILAITSCSSSSEPDLEYNRYIDKALTTLGLDHENIALPKVPYPVSTRARLPLVDTVLNDPPILINIANSINDTRLSNTRSEYLANIVRILDKDVIVPKPDAAVSANNNFPENITLDISNIKKTSNGPMDTGNISSHLIKSIQTIYIEIMRSVQIWEEHGGKPSKEELQSIFPHLDKLLSYAGTEPDTYRILPEPYHIVGGRLNNAPLLLSLLQLFMKIEKELTTLVQAGPIHGLTDWETPYGLVRLAGTDDDHHEGNFLLLIDLGGNDIYNNIGAIPRTPGAPSVVIDIEGNDSVSWSDMPGPGSGILGIGLWLDLDGNDHYQGGNMGLGAALFGSGLFWDEAGDDTYDANVLVQGVGQYGTGIFVDQQGNDRYKAHMTGQGFGGPGGIGILLESSGNDRYECAGKIPDQNVTRTRRHKEKHYVSFCQGYGFGFRPDISGGIGLLFDRSGHDEYMADIFAQGGAYWFGLGMLLDSSGNDSYKAFEHCQGASLHLGAGFLGDLEGNDQYTGYEHCQGVGMDRATGILYDASGNDHYDTRQESQGAGLKPYGVGILIDEKGNDTYSALRHAQGYAKPDPNFPDSEWPTGMLLDLGGTNAFNLPYSDPVTSDGRIQNKQGIAINKGRPDK